MRKKIVLSALIFMVFVGIKVQAQDKSGAFEYSKNLEIYANLLKTLRMSYIDTLNFSELNRTAIDALLDELDPYTVFIPEAEKENFEYVRTGEYGGVGLLVVKRPNDYAYVSNLIPDAPAQKSGIQIGDKIVRIDGRETKDLSQKELSNIFKGDPGQPFLFTIERKGEISTIDFLLTRQKIKVQNIGFFKKLDHDIGYIALRTFTLNAAYELMDAFLNLKEQHIKGLIIDLRGNGGGLIIEAVHGLNIFLQRGLEVVRTEGRHSSNEYVYRTQRPPLDISIPLVFLVDDQTASAAEIMAGAAQDFDRAVLIGQNTYGKGLVQNVLPLNYDSQLKLTIARYLLPSGRKILKEADVDSVQFKTLNGRIVYEGKGLTPDIILPKKLSDPGLSDQRERQFIFMFVNEYLATRPVALDKSFRVDDAILDAYYQYLNAQNYQYNSPIENSLIALRKQVEKKENSTELVNLLKQAEEQQRAYDQKQSARAVNELKDLLTVEFLSRKYFREGALQQTIAQDPEVQKAVEVLRDRKTYMSLVRPQ